MLSPSYMVHVPGCMLIPNAERRCIRLPPRRRWVGARLGLYQLFWHDGWDLCSGHGVDDSSDFLWGENPPQDCAVASYFVIKSASSSIHFDQSNETTLLQHV